MKRQKLLIISFALAVAMLTGACGSERPSCEFCGFNPNEQVQDVGTGGGLYTTNTDGCITIINTGDGACSRFLIQPLVGTQS